jgi:acetyl esterase/lipase
MNRNLENILILLHGSAINLTNDLKEYLNWPKKNLKSFLAATLASTFFMHGQTVAQKVIPLYKEVPNSITNQITEQSDPASRRGKVSHVTNPTLTIFLPDTSLSNGTAVIICPGGGYSFLVMNDEGYSVAKQLVSKGIAAFVLKYRLPDDQIMKDKSIGPLQDAQQAIKTVREQAQKWHITSTKVGIMGFSAGGHLASTLSTHYSRDFIENPRHTNLRSDFSILIYPLVSFKADSTHKGTRKALIGENANPATINKFSNELQVTSTTPPAFLVACSDDKVVPVENSLRYYEALHKHGVNAEIHIYEHGGHGFGLQNKTTNDKWLQRCYHWMQANKLL